MSEKKIDPNKKYSFVKRNSTQGNFSEVVIAKNIITQELVAIKRLSLKQFDMNP